MHFRILTSCLLLLLINTGFGSCMRQEPGSPQHRYQDVNTNADKERLEVQNKRQEVLKSEILYYSATCADLYFNETLLTKARANACAQLPDNSPDMKKKLAFPYNPEKNMKLPVPAPYYLYPMVDDKYIKFFKSKYYISPRIIINHYCEIAGAISQYPKLRRIGLASFTSIFLMKPPESKQGDYFYKKCVLFEKTDYKKF